MPKCPDCTEPNEQHLVHTHTSDPDGHTWAYVKCERCDGSNEISDDAFAAYQFGRQLRERRVADRVTIRERGAQLGVLPSLLSRVEFGSLSPDAEALRQKLKEITNV